LEILRAGRPSLPSIRKHARHAARDGFLRSDEADSAAEFIDRGAEQPFSAAVSAGVVSTMEKCHDENRTNYTS
jgi:hypothetical protein